MNPTPTLFDMAELERPKAPRRRFVMHVVDAGCDDFDPGPHEVRFGCDRCGHKTDWTTVRTVTEGKAGVPCPVCNGAEGGGERP